MIVAHILSMKGHSYKLLRMLLPYGQRFFLYLCIQTLVGAKVCVRLGDTLSIKGHSYKLLRMLLPYGQRFFCIHVYSL